ncbi:MAG: transcription antitermination factor NusB [Oscillospiraceae bacterium]
MKRRTSRENAFIAAFSATFEPATLEEIIADSRESGEYAVDAYGEALLINYEAHKDDIDELITSKLKDWTLARIPRTAVTILRLAVAEMLYSEEDMDSIVINEAVEIAKKYCQEEDYQFINGVLGAISRSDTKGVSQTEPCGEQCEKAD